MKRLLIGLVVAVVVVGLLGAGVLLLVDAERFRPQIEATLGEALGRDVTLGRLGVSIWTGSLDADTIRIGEDPAFGKEAFVTAKSLALGVRLWPLLARREVQVTSLALDNPVITLRQSSAGHWNFSSLARGKKTNEAQSAASAYAPKISVDTLSVKNGRIEVERAAGDKRIYTDVQLGAEQLRSDAAFPFTASARLAGAGTLEIGGELGPWNSADAALTPLDARLQMHDVDLAVAGLVGGDDGIGGVIDTDTRIRSQDGVLRSSGAIDVRKLKLMAAGSPAPQALRIDYKANYQLAARSGRIDDTTIGSGAARLTVNGTFDNRKNALKLDLHAAGQQLPTDDVQALLPAFGVILPEKSKLGGGTLGFDLDAKGPLDALSIGGPVTLDNVLLEGFSLGSKLGTALSLAGIKTPRDTMIRHADATISMQASGITLDPLNAEIVDLGKIMGQGSMTADGSLDFRMRVLLDSTVTAGQDSRGVGGVLGKLLGGAPDDGIGVRVTGTASEPRFKVDPRAAIGMLGAGLSALDDKDSSDDADDKQSGNAKRPEDLLKDLLQNALKPKKNK